MKWLFTDSSWLMRVAREMRPSSELLIVLPIFSSLFFSLSLWLALLLLSVSHLLLSSLSFFLLLLNRDDAVCPLDGSQFFHFHFNRLAAASQNKRETERRIILFWKANTKTHGEEWRNKHRTAALCTFTILINWYKMKRVRMKELRIGQLNDQVGWREEKDKLNKRPTTLSVFISLHFSSLL